MKKSNYTDQDIDDYIMDRLNKGDKSMFEAALSSNDVLNERFNDRKVILQGIEEYHAQVLKNKFKQIHNKAFNDIKSAEVKTTPTSSRNLFPWIAAAVLIAALIALLFWKNNTSTPAQPDELYASYFKAYELQLAQRNQGDEQLLQLEQLYNDKQYEKAFPIFNSLINTNNPPSQLQLGAGISKLGLQQPAEALPYFEAIIKSNDLLYKDHATWYAALAYIKTKDLAKAKQLLTSLAKNKSADHHKEAVELLTKLQ